MLKALTVCVLTMGVLAGSMAVSSADPPELASWRINPGGVTGYNSLPADVQQVRYSTGNVYVNASGIPDYPIGPWASNPNTPVNKAFLLRFPRLPVENTGAKTSTPLGPIGSWTNGVVMFNPLDAHSYNNHNIWHQNAVFAEAVSFDSCLGHPAPDGSYHQHQNARCMYSADSAQHSPLLGFAFDGFPVYGPYAYKNTDGSGGIARMRSSYFTRSITVRQTLADGTVLTPTQYGPVVSVAYPLGYYVEDFAYSAGLGDLDAYNGRFAVTRDYPLGTYAYYVTIDSLGNSVYPYAVGPSYFGVVAMDNITSHGKVTLSEAVSTYSPTASVGGEAGSKGAILLAHSFPNPAGKQATISFSLPAPAHAVLRLLDVGGRPVAMLADADLAAGTHSFTLDASRLPAGVYFYRLSAGSWSGTQRMMILR